MITYGELFAGVSGMGLGFDAAGMIGKWRVEIDRAAAGVLARHHPDDILEADVVAFAKWISRLRKHDRERFNRYSVSVLGGGSPCQDLSVAGLRAGLDGERSGLFRVMVRICRLLRPRIVVWENVLGALSSNEGRDFACVIGAFTGCVPTVPDDGWGYGGFARAAAPGRWNVAWRVLDSEYFGVPQRRYRVFLVASLGDGSCAEILFEPESVRGDPAPSRQAGEAATGTLSARTGAGGGLGTDMELAGGVVAADIAPTLNAAFGNKLGLENQHIDRGGGFSLPAVARTLTTSNQRIDAETETLIPTRRGGFFDDGVAHTLRGEGFDASEDGTGRGTPLVPIAFNWQAAGNQTTLGASDETAATLSKSTTQAVAFQSSQSGVRTGEAHATLDSNNGSRRHNGALTSAGVRRLTPRECERLQGWPDDHTRFRFNVKRVGNEWNITSRTPIEQADGPRYRQCGNGITATVSAWIGKRIVRYAFEGGLA